MNCGIPPVSVTDYGAFEFFADSSGEELPRAAPVSAPEFLHGEVGHGWKTCQPILLTIERDEDGEFIATDSFSTVYGNGKTRELASNDYCDSLVDYCEFLAREASRNSQSAVRLYRMNQFVRRGRSGQQARLNAASPRPSRGSGRGPG